VLTPVRSGQFRRDVKRAENRGKDPRKLRRLSELLIGKEELPASYKDHPLKGSWQGYRDAPIEPDWLLFIG
jgi:mRNA interferase YafQ